MGKHFQTALAGLLAALLSTAPVRAEKSHPADQGQIALAVAAASGRLNAQALARYTRRLEVDMATVALNQTAVGFAHGADTFGWR